MASLSFFSEKNHPFHRVMVGIFAWIVGSSFAIWGINFALADESTPFFNPEAGGPPQGDHRDFSSPGTESSQMREGMPGGDRQPTTGEKMMPPPGEKPGQMPEKNSFGNMGEGQQGFGGRIMERGDMNGQMQDDRSMGEDQSEQSNQDEERREAQQQEMMKRQFEQMKKGMKKMQPMLKRMSTRIASMQKSGIGIPEEITNNLQAVNTDLNTVLNASSFDDEGVQEALEDLQSKQQDLQEAMPILERLAQVPSMMKRAQSEARKLDTSLAKAKKAAAKSKIDVSSSVQDFEQAVIALKAGMEKVKTALKSGDAEEAVQALEEEVFEKMQEARQYEQALSLLQNVSSNLGKMTSFISQSRSKLVRMQKAGQDVADTLVELDEMTKKVSELKSLLSQKPISPEDINDVAQELWEKRQDVEEVLGQATNTMNFSHSPSAETKDFQDFKQLQF